MAYPPFTSLANVIIRDRSLDKAMQWSNRLSQFFAPQANNEIRVLGPASAPLSRLKIRIPLSVPSQIPQKSRSSQASLCRLVYADARKSRRPLCWSTWTLTIAVGHRALCANLCSAMTSPAADHPMRVSRHRDSCAESQARKAI
jgi:hypothetical protein